VFFTNPAAFVQIGGKQDKTPVFIQSMGDAARLLEYISNREATVNEAEASKICEHLYKLP
jgi:hypothetical protein